VRRVGTTRRFSELVGCLMLGAAVAAPDDVAAIALEVAERTLALIDEGLPPRVAYQMALMNLGLRA
jgi:hypothetical protein